MKKLFASLVLALFLAPFGALAAVDVNTADAAALEQIKGVGPARAAAIVKYRNENGPFTSVDELVKVPGIGEKSVEQLRDQVTAGSVISGSK